VGGITTGEETEGKDRSAVELPAIQTAALKALKATGKPVVLVLCSGSSLAIPWEAEAVDAIVETWYSGQGGGTALADMLFGDCNPAGRLPLTFYRATSDLRPLDDYAMANRTYRYFTGKVLWPFGFGLSYTSFEYEKPRVTCVGRNCTATVLVKNVGSRDGEEVVQVYVKSGKSGEPLKSLKGFKRAPIAAGRSLEFTLPLPEASFETFDEASNRLVVVPGTWQVCVGASSAEADSRCVVVTIS
jgi:beta-glucosidase